MIKLKRLISAFLCVVLIIVCLPITATVSAVSGIQEQIDKIVAVYPSGSYFTASGASHRAGGSNCPAVCYECMLQQIPARGGLPSGGSTNADTTRYQCYAFASYVAYIIFGDANVKNWQSVSVENAKLGDIIYFNLSGDHWGVYLYTSGNNVVVYDGNYDYYCGVNYGSVYSINSVRKVYHAYNYDDINHSHKYTSSLSQSPTCTGTGVITYSCTCGSSYNEPVAAKGHSWDSGEIVDSASCTEEGVKKYTCSTCSETYTEVLQASGHTEKTDDAISATCSTPGLTEGSHCSVCSAVIVSQESVPALGHDFVMMVDAEPTCDSGATVSYSCTRCTFTDSEEITQNGWSEWTETIINGVESNKIKTKTQYRASLKETITSNEEELPGWTIDKSQNRWSEYGEWSNWSTDAVTPNDSRDVQTKTVTDQEAYTSYSYHRYISDSYGRSSYTKADSTYSNIQYYTAGKLTAVPRLNTNGHQCYTSSASGSTNYTYLYWDEVITEHPAVTHTEYRYRERSPIYYYYRWSDFSDWQDNEIVGNDELKIETREIYSYNLGALGHDYVDGACTRCYQVDPNATVNENAPIVVLDTKEVTVGGTVSLGFSIKNNPGIAGLAVSLKYDESVLTLKDTENGGLFSGFTAAKNFAWDESEDVTDDGVLATFVFTVAENAPAGDYNIEVLVRSCTNEDLDDVELLTINGIVSVIDFVYGDSNGDQKIDMKDVVLLRKYITNFDYDTNTSSVNVELGADANGDNKIDMKDVVILRKYITNYDYDTESSTVVLGPQ